MLPNWAYQRQHDADRLAVGQDERQRILALAADFPAVWRDPNTPQRERKRMLALLLEDITLTKRHEVTVAVRFRGGATTILTLSRPLTPQQLRATHAEVRKQIDDLLNEYTDAQVANLLNQRELHTGGGDPFDSVSVQWVRFSAKLKSLRQRLLEAGWLTSKQVAAQLGVGRTAVGRMRGLGQLRARICSDRGVWLHWPPDRLAPDANAGCASGAANACDDVGEAARQAMRDLFAEHTDGEIARLLNQRGLRTSLGKSFDAITVRWVRRTANGTTLKDRLMAAGMLTAKQIAAKLGVEASTVRGWRREGRIEGRIGSDRGERLYWLPGSRQGSSAHTTATSTARGAV